VTILAWQRGGGDRSCCVVLLHTWASDGTADWEQTGVAAALAQAWMSSFVPDLPGHGESSDILIPPETDPARWTAQACLTDLDRMGIRRFAVVGYADGGPVAAHLAARSPERIDRLVLIGCDDAEMPHAHEAASALRDPATRVWNPGVAEIVARARRDRRHHLPTLAQWIERRRWPAAPRLSALRVPVLLAVSAEDPRRASLPRLAQLFHDARLVTVPDGSTSLLCSQELVRQLVDFLAPAVRQPPVYQPS
jgi:pimeloyl-ACP methyl ester carboxylesterase